MSPQYLCHTNQHSNRLTSQSDIDPIIWAEAAYGGEDGRSHTGTVTRLGNNSIGWSFCRKDIVAISTSESEYITMTARAQEAVWIDALLNEWAQTATAKPILLADNEGAKMLSIKPEFH
jgi:hypothetical protein